MDLLRVDDYAQVAEARLPADIWGYIDGGSGTEWTLAENRAAFERITLRPRFLVDVHECDTSTSLLGTPLAAPIGVAPMAYHRLVHPDGELATAEAIGAVGGPFVVSIFASQPVEKIAEHASGPLWLQLYWLRQRDQLVELVRRAEGCGFEAIVLTVDTPKVGRRLRDLRNSFTLPEHVSAVNLADTVMATSQQAVAGSSALERHSRERFDSTITWADLGWLRDLTTLPLLVKGVLTAEDARLAVQHGFAGVIVSNHGGRQLDAAPAAITALPEVVAAVDGRVPVLLDGGVRTGNDVFRALALGARTVFVGRPALWGLAAGGADGATRVLGLLRDELVEAMTLAGRPTIADIDSSSISL
jgi:4-hydroxymandelate oxidase